ncbi:MAG: efflux RND transporter periplasmic adaptor subunit [Planctomycetes bacterium]|nr:efflux RND transporter periplasmic adaptor subunit [Planctomycetota bacterium]
MKFSFTRPDKRQQSVHQAQENFKNARPEKLPIARFLMIGAGVILLLALIYTWWASNHIYATGVVSSQTDTYNSPTLSRIGDVLVQPGDVVSEGQDLYELISDEAKIQYEQVEELIHQQKNMLKGVDPKHPILSLLYDQSHIQSLHAAQLNIDAISNHIEKSERKKSLNIEDRKTLRDISVLQKQVIHYKQITDEKKKNLDDLEYLFKLDAATARDVQNARRDSGSAAIDFDSAQTSLKQLEEGMLNNRQDRILDLTLLHKQQANADAHYQTLKSRFDVLAQQECDRITSEIKRLTIRSEKFQEEAGPKMYYARNAGVVGEIPSSTGSVVQDGSLIMNIATTGTIWIDAYIPTDRAQLLDESESVSIISRTHNKRFKGKHSGGGLEVNVPKIIYNIDKSMIRAIHVRVSIRGSRGKLKPGNIVDVIFRRRP